MPSSKPPMSWSRWIDPCRLAGAAALLLILATPATAQDQPSAGIAFALRPPVLQLSSASASGIKIAIRKVE